MWLHCADWEIDIILSDKMRVEWTEIRFIRHTICKLTNTAQYSSTVSFHFSFFFAHSKLNCKPINSGQSSYFRLRSAKRSKSNLLREICKLLMRKHRSVAKKFMKNVGLWSVEWLRRMTDILCRAENPKCK